MSDANKEIINILEKVNKSQNIERDVNLFKDDYNYLDEKKQRFTFEIFLDYEVIRKNSNDKKNNVNNKVNKDKDKKNNFSIWGTNKKDESEDKINDLIKKMFQSSDNIKDDEITFLMNYVEKNKENKDNFIDVLKNNYCAHNQFIKINNIYNFNALANLIQLIADSYTNEVDTNLDKFYFILKLAEYTIFYDTEFISVKNYLCQKMSSLNLVKQKNFGLN